MQLNIGNINYKFIPSKIHTFDSIKKQNLVLKNDIYEKYNATAKIDGELVICKDTHQLKKFEKKIIRESYEDYIKDIVNRDPKKDVWIYNIIDCISEQDSILYRDDLCIVIPSYMWDGKNMDKLHILCMPIDVTLRCIRSLNNSHIFLLEYMKTTALQIIKEKYDIDDFHLKIFFHYEPSTYHLHIHFVNIADHEARSSVEYSHELNNVLFNLSICSDYYQKAVLNKRV